jgi:IclR family acetate operon transcriptional repressor
MSVAPPAAGRTDMVGKALRLLTALGELPAGATLSELSRAVGYPTSTTFRLLGTLARDGFVEFDEATKRYRLGLTLFALGQRVSQAHGFGGVALPIMQNLSAVTREASLMSVLDGDQQLYVHYVDGPQQVNVIGEPGKHGPIHNTSMGKVLIAFAPPDVREHLLDTLDLVATGPNTVTDREALRAEIARVRRDGYAVADEEHEAGILAVGVPVLDPSGTAIAALSVAAPAFRTSKEHLVGFVPHLTAAAHELALRLPTGRAR